MTGTHGPQQDGSIGEMLRDSGLDGATELRNSLEQLRALVPERAPAPRADLAALLAAGAPESPTAGFPGPVATAAPAAATAPVPADGALPPGVPNLMDRRKRNRRLAIVAGTVAGAMSLGAGAVAASSEDFRLVLGQTLGILFQPAGHVPAPKRAEPSPAGIPAIPPAPAVPGAPAASAPAPAVPGAPAASAPAPFPAADASHVPGKFGWPGAGRILPTHTALPAVGGAGELPAPDGLPVTPGLPELPGTRDPDGVDDDVLGPHLSPVPAASTPAPTLPAKFPGQP